MFCLNVRLQYGVNLEKMVLKIGKLRNCIPVICNTTMNSNNSNALIRQNMSCYSASKIVPHFQEFRMMDYDIIGFDLDGTLIRYELNNMVLLEHRLLKEFLVNEKNYPEKLLHKKFVIDFHQKGLIIDGERGNVIKLSENGTILKAAHGTRFMNVNEIRLVYGELQKWNVAQEYIKDPLSAWNGPIAEKLRALLDYFDIGAALVFAQAVDILDDIPSSKYTLGKSDYTIWPDVLAGLIKIYSREHFATGQSGYFEELKRKPDKYLLKTNDKVVDFLKELKASGKALYLLTGSNIDFANFTASYALGPQWYELFDYTIAFAKKPGFFYAQRQFLKINNFNEVEGSEIPLEEYLIPNTCYSRGNWRQLKESLCKNILYAHPEQVRSLYVGDNLIQDIFTPNNFACIDTLALSEELLENEINYDFKSMMQSLWGSYFSYEGTPTLWSTIIGKYSQLCVSHVDELVKVLAKEKIHCENKEGYFPK